MKEELISFETAKLAKEKGFLSATSRQYDSKGECHHPLSIGIGDEEYLKRTAAPAQSLLQKWLREEYNILVIPTFSKFSRTYGYKIYHVEDGETKEINSQFIKKDTYESALEKGIYEALKIIKI